jgi:putative inorganic carbon (HCO3(-)) transporter
MTSSPVAERPDEPIRHGRRHYLVILAIALFYLYVYYFQESFVRYGMIGAAGFAVLLALNSDLRFWLAVFCITVVFGGGTLVLGEFTPDFTTLAALMLFAGYLFRRMFWRSEPIPVTYPGKMVLAAIIVQAASVFVSIHVHGQYPMNAVREAMGMFIMVPLMFMVPDIFRGEDGVARVTKVLMTMLLVAGLFGMVQRATATGFSKNDLATGYLLAGRFQSTFGDPNQFAGFLELVLPVSLAVALTVRSRVWRVVAGAAFVTGMLSVLYTYSRGGFISCVLATAVILVVRFRKRLVIALLLMVLFAGAIAVNKDRFSRQINLIVDPSSAVMEPTLLHRYITYQRFWYEFTQRPFLGSGWGSREFYWGRTLLYSFWEIRHIRSTRHIDEFGGLNSLFLNSMVKGGLISLTSLMLVIGAVAVASAKALRSRRGLITLGYVTAMGAFFLHQLMDNLLRKERISAIFFIELGVLVAISLLGRKQGSRPLEEFFEGSGDGAPAAPPGEDDGSRRTLLQEGYG